MVIDEGTEGVVAVSGERYHTSMRCGGCQEITPVADIQRARDRKALDRWGRPLYLCRDCRRTEAQSLVDAEAVRRRHAPKKKK